MRPPTSTHRLEDYTVGWICALPIELSMAIGMLDGNHASLAQPSNDSNNYTLGRIGEHNVAIACLPTGLNGTNSVASSAARIQQTFRSMRFFLLVGTGDGVPTVTDIRLGDIVVADPRELQGGAIQYVLQKSIQSSRIEKLYSLRDPPAEVLSAMSSLRARHLLEDTEVPRYLSEMTTRYPKMQKNISYPGQQHDLLFETSYRHQGVPGKCAECDHDRVISRSLRDENTPAIHYGRIASAADVISDGEIRDHLGILTHIACFETEAAGFPEDYPCLVIRGIHGYADSHASERWRPYAAATAAAYAKELLSIVPAHQNTPVKTTASSSRLFNMFRKPK